MLNFTDVPAASPSAKAIGDKVREVTVKLLETRRKEEVTETDEELARGVKILDHEACMERIGKGTGALLHDSSGQVATGSLLVGVLLPVSAVRDEEIRDKLLDGMREAGVSFEGVTGEVADRTTIFSRFTSVQDLRKWLAEKSLADLSKVLA